MVYLITKQYINIRLDTPGNVVWGRNKLFKIFLT